MRSLLAALAWVFCVALIAACDPGGSSAPTLAGPAGAMASTTTFALVPTSTAQTQPPQFGSEPTTAAPEPLPPGTRHLTIGETWAFTFATGCGYPRFFNDTWWLPTTLTFTHPDYPPDWTVEILDLGPVDGPTAIIHDATITLVDPEHIEIRLTDGQLVAIYEPTIVVGLCG